MSCLFLRQELLANLHHDFAHLNRAWKIVVPMICENHGIAVEVKPALYGFWGLLSPFYSTGDDIPS